MAKKNVMEITSEINLLKSKAANLSDAARLLDDAVKSMSQSEDLDVVRTAVKSMNGKITAKVKTLNEQILVLEEKTVN